MWIDTNDALTRFLEQHATPHPAVIGIDTEFVREETYWPDLCVIQLALGQSDDALQYVAIDAHAVDIGLLKPLLMDPKVVKVMHAGGQDIEMFVFHWGAPMPNVYDTQIAAGFTGDGDQIGYAALVQGRLNQTITKGHQRTDWRRRPLSDAQIDYCIADVVHLHPLKALLDADLAARGRTEWIAEETDAIVARASVAPDPRTVHHRVKGIHRLPPKIRVIARGLCRWREEQAIEENAPRKRIFPEDVLIDVAQQQPTQRSTLTSMRRFPGRAKRYADAILDAVKNPPDTEAPKKPPAPLTPTQEATLDLCNTVLKSCALNADIAPRLIANKRDLEAVVRGQADAPIFAGWRAEVAGHDVQAVLDGAAIRVKDGRVVVER